MGVKVRKKFMVFDGLIADLVYEEEVETAVVVAALNGTVG
jgi:hypothetical protein